MPSKLKAYMVRLPPEMKDLVEKEATFNRRPVANQIIWILDRWFEERSKELDHFRPSPLREVKRQEAPIFETPDQLPVERASKIRATLDQERS